MRKSINLFLTFLFPLSFFLFPCLMGFAFTLTPLGVIDTGINQPAWDDRSIFKHDLVSSWQGITETLTEIPIYRLNLELSDDLASVQGEQDVLFTNTTGQVLNELVFRLYPNALGSSLVVSRTEINGVLALMRLEQENTTLRVFLAKSLAVGEQIVVSMSFVTTISENSLGYGRLSRYSNAASSSNALSLAHAYPILSVFRNGAWLTPYPDVQGDPAVAEAAYYWVKVVAPLEQTIVASGTLLALNPVSDISLDLDASLADEQAPYTSLSNTESSNTQISNTELSNTQAISQASANKQTLIFVTGPAREFYLASVYGYERFSERIGETLVTAFVPERYAESAELSTKLTVQALERFNKFSLYPYRELDVVVMPIQASGIEFPGVFSLATQLIANPQGALESVIAHETAHQWSYNLVGSNQMSEPWLDEALAQYLTLLYQETYKTDAIVKSYLRFWQNLWDNAPDAQMPIGQEVSDYDETSYSAIVYGRGLFFFKALAEQIGEERLNEALSDFYKTYAWQFVTSQDLKVSLEASCECNLDTLFQDWVGE